MPNHQPPQQTPWGTADGMTQVADGIWRVDTPSHGGYWLSPERLRAMPAAGRAFAIKWSGSASWYEEDCGWACVALIFPEAFPANALEYARRLARDYFPELLPPTGPAQLSLLPC